MTNKLYDVNYFIVVLDYYKELVVGGGGNKKAVFFGGGAFTRVNISYVLFCALGEGLGYVMFSPSVCVADGNSPL